MSVVIVGAGMAAWSVVDALRALDGDIAITLITADSGGRYQKPMLSIGIGQNKSGDDLLRQSGVVAAQKAQVQLLAHATVLKIDTKQKTLITTNGNISYDKLVLAIGAKPYYPPTIHPRQAHHVNHLDDYARLYQALQVGRCQVAVIGAGMVGVELAEDLTKAGHQVSLIDKNAYPLFTLFPQQIGNALIDGLTKLGISYLNHNQVLSIAGDDIDGNTNTPYVLTLQQGDTITTHRFDQLIVATGLTIDETLLTPTGIAFDKRAGILVDKNLRTSQDDVFALGDCIAIDGKPCRYIAPHRTQANVIAHAILGRPHPDYQHKSPIIRLKNKAITLQATGNPTNDGNWQVINQDDQHIAMEQIQDGEVCATVSATWR